MPNISTKKAEARSYQVRGIKKDFYTPIECDTLTPQFHLELGEKNQIVIVEDRKCDWIELSNRDLDQVGIANILRMAAKGLVDGASLMFTDNEAVDLTGLDPMNPGSVKATIASKSLNEQKLQAIADKLGVTTDALIDSVIKGTVTNLISSKLETKAEESEVKTNG